MSAHERLQRLLALVPWVAAHDGPLVADVCTRFGCTEAELASDLDLLFLCGLHPYTPDTLIDVDVADGRVWIRYADYFSRPLRLTPAEGLALLVAGTSLLATPGAMADSPLGRGLGKLAAALGVGAEGSLDVSLGPAPPETLRSLSEAASEHRQVELDYYAFGRDEWTRRVVDPYAVFSAGGQWYVSAYCHAVDDERLFRVDRVRRAVTLDNGFDPPAGRPELTVYRARPDDPRVTLELEPAAGWVVEQYPTEGVETIDGGRLRVTLAVSERAWLERLLLRLGPAATVVTGDDDVASAAACRLLGRYRAVASPPWSTSG
ncbi:MAG TPA: WYL domain-containing protein [Acidimicrobiales bacterium]|nr:WYL domain-containing protein [Acidimicrobiales bacterium]